MDGCIDYCYTWVLEKVYASAHGQGIPLVVAYIHGDAEKLHHVMLGEFFEADESWGIWVAFGITASARSASGEISYSIPGFTLKLGGDNHLWLGYYKTFFEGRDFSGNAILAIGMKGDLAFAEYKLKACVKVYSFGWGCEYSDEEADMTLARPVIEYDEIVPWSSVDTNPYDGVGVAEKAFRYIRSSWKWSEDYVKYGGILIDSFMVERGINTLPLFITSAAILPLVLEAPKTLPPAAIASVTIGPPAYVLCDIGLKTKYALSDYVWANYFYSPVKFSYEDSEYYVGSMYIDALVG
ncbi:MAG: hypothetical protein ABWW69_07050 [Pyrodictiaceae archaeon]